jgi:flagellar biosynthetic protein FliR
MTLETVLMTQLYAFLLIFSRVGSAFMTLPGFSDSTLSPQIRVLFALSFSLVLTPVLYASLPAAPPTVFGLALLILREMITGIFIGALLQVMISALAFAGFLTASSMAMSNAMLFSPTMSSSSTVIGSFLVLLGTTLFFSFDLHHQVILGVINSYHLFEPGGTLFYGDMAQHMAEIIGESLVLGLKIAAPFLIINIGILVSMGLLARMVPQIQVFILSVPAQMLVGTIALFTIMSAMMMYFIDEFDLYLKNFLAN